MTINKLLSATLRFCLYFVPFYWIYNSSSKNDHFNEDNPKYYKIDYFKNSDLKQGWRAGFRFFGILLTFLAVPLSLALLTHFTAVAWWVMIPVFIVGLGILPGIVEQSIKQIIRGISSLIHHGNPDIINATYPKKYKPYTYDINDNYTAELKVQLKQADDDTKKIMKALYMEKQVIKNKPENCSGLSKEQKKQCDAINLAVKFFRNNSYKKLEIERRFCFKELKMVEKPPRFTMFKFNSDIDRIPEGMESYLKNIIHHAVTNPSPS